MKTIAALFMLFAVSQAATLLPVDSSVVNVKSEHSGQDYSYSIQENRGFAVNPTVGLHHAIPIVKTVPEVPVHGPELIHVEPQPHHEVRPQSLAKTVPEQTVPEHGVPVGSYPTTYLSYVPISYQYGFPYGYTSPYNFLTYRVA